MLEIMSDYDIKALRQVRDMMVKVNLRKQDRGNSTGLASRARSFFSSIHGSQKTGGPGPRVSNVNALQSSSSQFLPGNKTLSLHNVFARSHTAALKDQ